MARKTFKNIVNICFPENFDRVLYNYATMIVIFLMCFLWDPLPNLIWSVTIPWLRYPIIGISIQMSRSGNDTFCSGATVLTVAGFESSGNIRQVVTLWHKTSIGSFEQRVSSFSFACLEV